MSNTKLFLANVVALEGEAASHYEAFAQRALAAGDSELEAFFSGLAELTRLEAAEASANGGLEMRASIHQHRIERSAPAPRSAVRVGSDALLELHRAMTLALELKRRSHAYYASIAALTADNELSQVASVFEHEAAGHLEALEKWIVRLSV
ncbi:hypothetical protein [Viridibacterium curvum]|uniref:Rubrerythrin diiron-binding domain-containing protein n=1 Tax=Viridibacterium curvum TaxID=1101404 RepID=A0ABP9R516_9RHOO